MSTSSLNDTAMTSSTDVNRDVNNVLRLNGAKSRNFGFRWRQRNADEINTSKNRTVKDLSSENLSNSKISNGFLKNIKKRLNIKNLGLCKVQQKIKEIDAQQPASEQISQTEEKKFSSTEEKTFEPPPYEKPPSNERVISSVLENSTHNLSDDYSSSNLRVGEFSVEPLEIPSDKEITSLNKDEYSWEEKIVRNSDNAENHGDNENENFHYSLQSGNIAEPQSTSAKETVETVENIIDEQISRENKAKVNLSEELLKLSKYGWYWGPISGDEADSKLVSEPDGAFLVRDSSDDRYLLTLSFKSSGRLLHARMEHSGGLFSLCNQSDNEGFTSVAALIDHSMNSSQSAVFCYSRPKYPGYPSFPVRLTKPVSRFTQVRSLQYLCRFVIRQNTRLDNIHKLPLPKTIRGYIEEAHY